MCVWEEQSATGPACTRCSRCNNASPALSCIPSKRPITPWRRRVVGCRVWRRSEAVNAGKSARNMALMRGPAQPWISGRRLSVVAADNNTLRVDGADRTVRAVERDILMRLKPAESRARVCPPIMMDSGGDAPSRFEGSGVAQAGDGGIPPIAGVSFRGWRRPPLPINGVARRGESLAVVRRSAKTGEEYRYQLRLSREGTSAIGAGEVAHPDRPGHGEGEDQF